MDKKEKIKIFVQYHKEGNKYINSNYNSLLLNANANKEIEMDYQDNTGDNISNKNLTYVDLTGVYWIWKNVHDCDYKGNVHYSRFFISGDNKILSSDNILAILKDYDAIITEFARLEGRTVYQIYNDFHGHENMDVCREVIRDIMPNYLSTFDEVIINGEYSSLYNMMIAKNEIFDNYCEWLFSILFELEKRLENLGRLNFTEEDYQRKVFGFIGERLMLVWLKYNNINYKEVPVGYFNKNLEKED